MDNAGGRVPFLYIEAGEPKTVDRDDAGTPKGASRYYREIVAGAQLVAGTANIVYARPSITSAETNYFSIRCEGSPYSVY